MDTLDLNGTKSPSDRSCTPISQLAVREVVQSDDTGWCGCLAEWCQSSFINPTLQFSYSYREKSSEQELHKPFPQGGSAVSRVHELLVALGLLSWSTVFKWSQSVSFPSVVAPNSDSSFYSLILLDGQTEIGPVVIFGVESRWPPEASNSRLNWNCDSIH